MAAPKGNRFWEARSSHGRKPIFESPELLWDACQQYFDWNENNPLRAAELVKFQGEAKIKYVPKMRVMTIGGMCMFIGISQEAWQLYRVREDYIPICMRAEEAIRRQKFEGASAEMLNPLIIARDLGLRDKQDFTHSGPDGGPIQTMQIEFVKADNEKSDG